MTLEVPEAARYTQAVRQQMIDSLHSSDWMKAIGIDEHELARASIDIVRAVLEQDSDVVEVRSYVDELRAQINNIIDLRADELAMEDGYLRPEDK